jgi:hypothetical protein
MQVNFSVDVDVVLQAVRRWSEFYEVPLDEGVSDTLCGAAIRYYGEGYRTADDLSTMLIGNFVGLYSTRINALTSASIH